MKTTKNTHPIPSELSALILEALADLERAENTPGYLVDMGTWHQLPNPMEGCDCSSCQKFRENPGKCFVCFAGSVMAFGLGAKRGAKHDPDDYPKYSERLYELDRIRRGYLPYGIGDIEITPFGENPERWKLEMVLTARALKEAGQ